MSHRATSALLEAKVRRLNNITGNPEHPVLAGVRPLVWNVGSYFLHDGAGGKALYRVAAPNGATEDVFRAGHLPKPELGRLLEGYISGYIDGKCDTADKLRPLKPPKPLTTKGAKHGTTKKD